MKLGITQGEWDALARDLLRLKQKNAPPVSLGKKHGGDGGPVTDTYNVTLDIALDIIHLDVDQGESTLVLLTCERELCESNDLDCHLLAVLIDGGKTVQGGGMLERALQALNVRRLHAVMVSHFDDDHVAGITRLIGRLPGTETETETETAAAASSSSSSSAAAPGGDGKGKEKVDEDEDEDENEDEDEDEDKDEDEEDEEKEENAYEDDGEDAEDAEDADDGNGADGEENNAWRQVGIERAITRATFGSGDKKWAAFDRQCRSRKVERVDATVGLTITLACDADRGHFGMECLSVNACLSTADATSDKEDVENDRSIAWLLRFGKFRYYTAGDLSEKVEDRLAQDPAIAAKLAGLTAVKCGHHGSNTSTSATFLDVTRPQLAFISAGRHGGYGHPNADLLLRLWSSAGMQAAYITNCYFGRPFASNGYPGLVVSELDAKLGAAVASMTTVDAELVETFKNGHKLLDARVREDVTMAQNIATAKEVHTSLQALRGSTETLRASLPDATSEQPAEWAKLDAEVKALVKNYVTWHATRLLAIKALRAGVPYFPATTANGTSSSKRVRPTYRSPSLTDGWLDSVRTLLADALTLATAGNRYARTKAGRQGGPPMIVAGEGEAIGVATLRILLDGCDGDHRACYVHADATAWRPYTTAPASGSSSSSTAPAPTAADTSLWKAVLTLQCIQLKPPGSPGDYGPYWESHTEDRTKPPIMSGGSKDGGRRRKPRAPVVYRDDAEAMLSEDDREDDDGADSDWSDGATRGSPGQQVDVRRKSKRKRVDPTDADGAAPIEAHAVRHGKKPRIDRTRPTAAAASQSGAPPQADPYDAVPMEGDGGE